MSRIFTGSSEKRTLDAHFETEQSLRKKDGGMGSKERMSFWDDVHFRQKRSQQAL